MPSSPGRSQTSTEAPVQKGGQLCYRRDRHPLARPDGYVVAARMVLHDRHEAEGVVAPCCWRCGKRVEWRPGGPGRTTRTIGRVRALLVEHLDGDQGNIAPRNLEPICARCLHRYVMPQPRRDRNGLFTSR